MSKIFWSLSIYFSHVYQTETNVSGSFNHDPVRYGFYPNIYHKCIISELPMWQKGNCKNLFRLTLNYWKILGQSCKNQCIWFFRGVWVNVCVCRHICMCVWVCGWHNISYKIRTTFCSHLFKYLIWSTCTLANFQLCSFKILFLWLILPCCATDGSNMMLM